MQSLAAGSHVVSVSDVYGGTHRYFTKVAQAHGVTVTFTPSIEADVEKLIRPETKLIWIETPSNPTLGLVDIRAIADVAHQHGITVVVDNTFMSPYVQNPMDHGADIVVHSVTKYINGHSVSLNFFLRLSKHKANQPRMSAWALLPSAPRP
jgi:cystathionine gamma-lyase